MHIHDNDKRYVIHPTEPVKIDALKGIAYLGNFAFQLQGYGVALDKREAKKIQKLCNKTISPQLEKQVETFSWFLKQANYSSMISQEKIKKMLKQHATKAQEQLRYEIIPVNEQDLEEKVVSGFDAFYDSLRGDFEKYLWRLDFPICFIKESLVLFCPSGIRMVFSHNMEINFPSGTTINNIPLDEFREKKYSTGLREQRFAQPYALFSQNEGRNVWLYFFYQPRYFTPILVDPNRPYLPTRFFRINPVHPVDKRYHPLATVEFCDMGR